MLRGVWAQAKRAIHGENKGRVLIASNRLPITAVRQGTAIQYRRSDGGLASGLRHVARQWPVRWYGWNGLTSHSGGQTLASSQRTESLIDICLTAADVAGYYTDFSNAVLWPALHGMTVGVEARPQAWERYLAVNKRFAAAIRQDLLPNDLIWIHDYHLFPLPRLLRRRQSDASLPITFFLHTPFPTIDVFRVIPHHRALLHGLMGSDVIGFHTEEYARNFLLAAQEGGYQTSEDRVLTDGRAVQVRVRPMGIDAEMFARLGSDPEVLDEVTRLRATKRVLMLGVDRLDYTKGIPERLLAFEKLLEERTELRGGVSLMQVAVPSRTENTAYIHLRAAVEAIVERVNRRFGSSGWTPIEYLYDTVDLYTLASLYRAADVMLVTPFRDGLNLVAKEFVATRVDGDGVLILSKYAGAAAELDAALACDPNKIKELAQTYVRAITMPLQERRRRMKRLMQSVMGNGITNWITSFLGDGEEPKMGVETADAAPA